MYFLYSAAFAVAMLLAAPWYLGAAKRRAGLREKLGRVPERLPAGTGCVWVHAVSVGEVLAVSRLVQTLRKAGRPVVVSTTTVTGQKLAREYFGETSVFYFPFDFAFAIDPYLRRLRPQMLVMAESEFWPNLFRLARNSGARVAVVNARISDRSLPGYLRLRFLWRGILRNVDLFLAQTAQDAERLVAIGAPSERVSVSGNLKFDIHVAADLPIVQMLRELIRAGGVNDVLVCGSTAPGEEEQCVQLFGAVLSRRPQALMVLAPRHPERFDEVENLVRASSLTCLRRSRLSESSSLAGSVLLLDSVGELAALYALATIAFVGGSFVPRGGHNILEPAQHGVPIVVGPHTENFREMVAMFARAGALKVAESLVPEGLALLGDPVARAELGRRAAELFRTQQGATWRTLAALQQLPTPAAAETRSAPVQVG